MAGALRGIPAVMVAEEWAGSFRRRTLERGRNLFREILHLNLLRDILVRTDHMNWILTSVTALENRLAPVSELPCAMKGSGS
jgi:hypothetical protein